MKTQGTTCTILLATYQGEPFLDAFLQSLLQQDYADWQLCVRDDGSSDRTLAILKSWEAKEPRIQILDNASRNRLGPVQNFAWLIAWAIKHQCDHLFLADQDDIWRADKLSRFMATALATENKHHPLLIHCDLSIHDEQLKPVSNSFIKHHSLHPLCKKGLVDLIHRNQITGSAMYINAALAEKMLPVPEQVIMHDWWAGLIAISLGQLKYIAKPLVIRREHGNNVTHLDQASTENTFFHAESRSRQAFFNTIEQARAFLLQFQDSLSESDKAFVHQYTQLASYSRMQRLAFFMKNWLLSSETFRQKAGLLYRMFVDVDKLKS